MALKAFWDQTSRTMMVSIIKKIIKLAFGLFTDEEFKSGFEKCVAENLTGDKLKLAFTKHFLQYSLNIPPLDSEVEGTIYNFYKKNLIWIIIIFY